MTDEKKKKILEELESFGVKDFEDEQLNIMVIAIIHKVMQSLRECASNRGIQSYDGVSIHPTMEGGVLVVSDKEITDMHNGRKEFKKNGKFKKYSNMNSTALVFPVFYKWGFGDDWECKFSLDGLIRDTAGAMADFPYEKKTKKEKKESKKIWYKTLEYIYHSIDWDNDLEDEDKKWYWKCFNEKKQKYEYLEHEVKLSKKDEE